MALERGELTKQKALLELAAEDIRGTSTSDFVLRAACIAAENEILDQTVVLVDEQRYAAFVDGPGEPAAAAREVAVTPALRG